MITYTTGEDVKKAVFAILKKEGTTLLALAPKIGTYQAGLSRTLNSQNPSFGAIRDIAAGLGYKLVFDIIPDDDKEKKDDKEQ